MAEVSRTIQGCLEMNPTYIKVKSITIEYEENGHHKTDLFELAPLSQGTRPELVPVRKDGEDDPSGNVSHLYEHLHSMVIGHLSNADNFRPVDAEETLDPAWKVFERTW
jgi:hypothetical protein